MGMDNKETIAVIFPHGFNRATITVEERTEFTGAGFAWALDTYGIPRMFLLVPWPHSPRALSLDRFYHVQGLIYPCHSDTGEKDTSSSTYSGVKSLYWGAMNLVSKEDKEKILGRAIPTPPPRIYDASSGQPLLYNERRNHILCSRILRDLKAKEVLDLTPGQGELAKACLHEDIRCKVLCRNAHHASWLQNVLDRAAMTCIHRVGHVLYDTDMASNIKKLYSDVLEQHNSQEAADCESMLSIYEHGA